MEAYLSMCLITINPTIMVAQREVIEMAPAVFPLTHSEFRVYSTSTSEMNLNIENLFNGKVPLFLCVALVSTGALNSDNKKNPFNFASFDRLVLDFM